MIAGHATACTPGRGPRRVLAALLAAGLVACAPVGAPAPPMARPGPLLVAEVTNQSDRDVVFSYEFEAVDRSSTGSGEGVVPACTVLTESWSEITGTYALMIDGEVLHEDRLAPGQGDGAQIFVRIRVGAHGDTELLAPVLRAAGPQAGSRPVPGC